MKKFNLLLTFLQSIPKYRNGHYLIAFCLLLMFLPFQSTVYGQNIKCGTEADPNSGSVSLNANCDSIKNTLDFRCVRLKFHIINNTNGAPTNFPDHIILGWLNEVNQIFASSKIQVSLGNNCIHRANLPTIKTYDNLTVAIGDILPPNFNPHPSLEWDTSAINIFFSKKKYLT